MRPTFPPSLGLRLLVAFVPDRTAEALCGDLIEQYRRGRSRAWFWRQVLVALVVSATHELRSKKLQAIRALLVGYSVAAVLCYFTTTLVAQLVAHELGNKTYLLFLPLVFFSAAVSGWVVRRSHAKPMVLVYAAFCVAAGIVAFAAYAWVPIFDTAPVPVLAFVAASDFVVGPAGVTVGGFWGSSADGNSSSPSLVN